MFDKKVYMKEYNKHYVIKDKEKRRLYLKEYYHKNKNILAKKSKIYKIKNGDKIKKYKEEYRIKNKDKISIKVKEYNLKNKDKISLYGKEYYKKNKDKIKKQSKEYRIKNKDKIKKYLKKYDLRPDVILRKKEYKKDYGVKNKDKIKEHKKEYRFKNKGIINKYFVKRRKDDINFKIAYYLRIRIRQVLKRNSKSKTTKELVGCSLDELKQHLEKQFTFGMNWKNYGFGWHIDHIIPCCSFDLSKPVEQKKCFHYTNLQPLWATENLTKGRS